MTIIEPINNLLVETRDNQEAIIAIANKLNEVIKYVNTLEDELNQICDIFENFVNEAEAINNNFFKKE